MFRIRDIEKTKSHPRQRLIPLNKTKRRKQDKKGEFNKARRLLENSRDKSLWPSMN